MKSYGPNQSCTIVVLLMLLCGAQRVSAAWGKAPPSKETGRLSLNETVTVTEETKPIRPRLDRRSALRLRDDPPILQDNNDGEIGNDKSSSSANNSDNRNDDECSEPPPTLLQQLGDLAQALLPSVHRLSDRANRIDNEMSAATGGLSDLWKDAPLPVRLMGGFLSPLLAKAVSGVTLSVQENDALVQQVLQQAHELLTENVEVLDLLGAPLLLSPSPFTERSSISGNGMHQIELSFTVSGSKEAGVAYLVATERGVQTLRVTTVQGHKSVDVSLVDRSGWLVPVIQSVANTPATGNSKSRRSSSLSSND